MVFPNFFITFVRHSFHTSIIHPHPCTPLSRETASPCTTPATRHHTPLMAHALPRYAHATLSRAAPRKGLCHTRCSPSQHTRPPRYTPRKGLCHAHAPRAKCRNAFPCSPLLSKKKERASTTKILHITILHVTFTRIGVKTTQKSEAIFSFID